MLDLEVIHRPRAPSRQPYQVARLEHVKHQYVGRSPSRHVSSPRDARVIERLLALRSRRTDQRKHGLELLLCLLPVGPPAVSTTLSDSTVSHRRVQSGPGSHKQWMPPAHPAVCAPLRRPALVQLSNMRRKLHRLGQSPAERLLLFLLHLG